MFEKIKENKEKIFVYGVFMIYAIVSLIGVITHESWADEAQAWLIARDLDLIGIIKQMQYEGHSCLWHLILFPFAKLGFPYETIKYISWIFVLIAVYLILKKAPFHKITKLLLVFNPAMIYLWPAISRCYALIPLSVVCIAILYKDREKYPYAYAIAIAFLANTHIIMAPMAGMLFLTFWGEELLIKRKELDKEKKKKMWGSFFLVVVGFLVLVLQVLPSLFHCAIFQVTQDVSTVFHIKETIEDIQSSLSDTTYYLFKNYLACTAIFYVIIEFMIVSSIYDKKQALIFWPQVIFGILVHAILWFVIKQRAVLWILYIMFFAWTYEPKFKSQESESMVIKKLPNVALFLILIITLVNYPMYLSDVKTNYSTSKEVAEFIEQNLPKGSVFICPNNESASSVIPYLDKEEYQFYAPNGNRYYTYVTWDEAWKKITQIKNIEKTIQKLKLEGKDNLYILITKYFYYNDDSKLKNEDKYELILMADDTSHEYYSQYEDYCLYKVK